MVQRQLHASSAQRAYVVTAKVSTEIRLHLHNLQRWRSALADPEHFIDRYMAVLDNAASDQIEWTDAFSYGQLNSKLWLISQLENIDMNLGKIWIMCGWIGTLAYLMIRTDNNLKFDHIRSFDIDPYCQTLADTLNRLSVKDGWQFKASTLDVNSISYDNFAYDTIKYDGSAQRVTDTADTIINTSCDHMGSDRTWWDSIPSDRLIILQNNNWFENDQHNNSAADLNEFTRMYPMSELLFAGELDCTLYTRFMLIGRK